MTRVRADTSPPVGVFWAEPDREWIDNFVEYVYGCEAAERHYETVGLYKFGGRRV